MMRGRRLSLIVALALLIGGGEALAAPRAAKSDASGWAAAWGAAPLASAPVARANEVRAYGDVTIRQVVRLNQGGTSLRLRLTNELSDRPLRVGAVSVATATPEGAPSATPIAVTFGGRTGVEIPPGAPILSDPVALPVKAMDRLSLAVFFAEPTTPSGHRMRVFMSYQGNHTAKLVTPSEQETKGPAIISGVEVRGEAARPVLVTLGDSITEGVGSTPNAEMGWPEQLAARLASRNGAWSVVNMGIGGGRLLHESTGPSALSRFDRDVLSVPGVAAVVILEGINDIGRPAQPGYAGEAVTSGELISAYRQMIERAHARGLKVYGGTLLPYAGAGYFTQDGEAKRQAVNSWIRGGGAFDGVIDFEAAMKDPERPDRIRSDLHRGDSLHPNDKGYGVMAEVADQALGALSR